MTAGTPCCLACSTTSALVFHGFDECPLTEKTRAHVAAARELAEQTRARQPTARAAWAQLETVVRLQKMLGDELDAVLLLARDMLAEEMAEEAR